MKYYKIATKHGGSFSGVYHGQDELEAFNMMNEEADAAKASEIPESIIVSEILPQARSGNDFIVENWYEVIDQMVKLLSAGFPIEFFNLLYIQELMCANFDYGDWKILEDQENCICFLGEDQEGNGLWMKDEMFFFIMDFETTRERANLEGIFKVLEEKIAWRVVTPKDL